MSVAEILQLYRENLLKIYDQRETKAIVQWVFEKVLELNSLKLEMSRYQLLTTNQQDELKAILERLLNSEPVQYVLGEVYFLGMKFNVNSSVLIPRPETEELVEWIAKEAKDNFSGKILDIGTGSGCIAIGLKKLLPNAEIFACDISEDALQTASQNSQQHNLPIQFFKHNILEQTSLNNSFDIVVSNPPYIPENEKEQIEKNVLNFEPHCALFTPCNKALIFYENIAHQCINGLLNKNGQLFFEIHFSKAKETEQLLRTLKFKNIEVRKDIFGKERMVKAQLEY
ncbi:MAG: peptide chain release factor N(5)-glutamine methyltransferase [Chitinophagales bacterium]|nr:peptide chain release factor N(5)-glutamine methyltransferase [Chitinophagales bacterium]